MGPMDPEKPGWDIMGDAVFRAASKGDGGNATDPLRLPAARWEFESTDKPLANLIAKCSRILDRASMRSMLQNRARVFGLLGGGKETGKICGLKPHLMTCRLV